MPIGTKGEKMKELYVGLSSWVIQDGNYSDFVKDDKAEFALEIYSQNIEKTDSHKTYCEHIEDTEYKIEGRVVFIDNEFLVIDVGILIYWQNDKSKFKVNDYISGNVFIGIDPFFYFESGYKNKGIPALIYTWRIKEIRIETAPFIENKDETGCIILVRDKGKSNKININKTDAWKDDNGHGDYTLVCELLEEKPKRKIV